MNNGKDLTPISRKQCDGQCRLLLGVVISCAALFLQLFPGVWWAGTGALKYLLSFGDVRAWGWKSYAVVAGLAVALLIFLKSALEGE